jgi:hypothetical protein
MERRGGVAVPQWNPRSQDMHEYREGSCGGSHGRRQDMERLQRPKINASSILFQVYLGVPIISKRISVLTQIDSKSNVRQLDRLGLNRYHKDTQSNFQERNWVDAKPWRLWCFPWYADNGLIENCGSSPSTFIEVQDKNTTVVQSGAASANRPVEVKHNRLQVRC